MAYLNGATTHETAASPTVVVPNSDQIQDSRLNPERIQHIREQLAEPFDPREIRWRVTATSTQQGRRGPQKRGQLVAYADQRAYTDRLNEVFGEWGWTRSYDVQVAHNFERRAPGDKKEMAVAAKVVVVSTVTIQGLGSHTGIGEEWADDENAATRAEAQAFKRACACFGLGRYLYDLDKEWMDLDQFNRPVCTPNLPDWALPGYASRQARQPAPHRNHGPRRGLVQEETLAAVKSLCEKVGHSLAQFVLKKYAGVTDPGRIGFAKLTTVLEKLTDIGQGIERLLKGCETLGEERYSAICKELNLASESIDDIQDRDALKTLLARVEVEAGNSAPPSGSDPRTGAPTLAEARGRLLQTARQAADKSHKRLGDVIAEASGGALTLDNLKNLSETDVPAIEAAISRLG